MRISKKGTLEQIKFRDISPDGVLCIPSGVKKLQTTCSDNSSAMFLKELIRAMILGKDYIRDPYDEIKEVFLPDSVEEIEASAFRNAEIEHINFPASLKIVEHFADECPKSINIENGFDPECFEIMELLASNPDFIAKAPKGAFIIARKVLGKYISEPHNKRDETVLYENRELKLSVWKESDKPQGFYKNLFNAMAAYPVLNKNTKYCILQCDINESVGHLRRDVFPAENEGTVCLTDKIRPVREIQRQELINILRDCVKGDRYAKT